MPKDISDRTAYMLAVNLNLSGNRLLRAKIQTVSALPDVTEYISEFVYLSTDNKVYYSNGTNWIAHTQNTDYQCTLDGHYTPTENTASDINVTSDNFVSGIKRDAKGHVTGIAQTALPTSLKNPNSLTIQGNGTTLANGVYDGSAAKTVNITPSSIGAAASSHTHTFSQITDGTTEVNALIDAKISTANAMIFKGTLDNSITTETDTIKKNLPDNHKVGETWLVAKAGTYGGKTCEVGDMFVCTTTRTTANDSDWACIQANWTAIAGNENLQWDTSVTLATIGGVEVKAKLPQQPKGLVIYRTMLPAIAADERYSITDSKWGIIVDVTFYDIIGNNVKNRVYMDYNVITDNQGQLSVRIQPQVAIANGTIECIVTMFPR